MRWQRRIQLRGDIPTTSLPDVVFLLLLFFMVTSIFKPPAELTVQLPEAGQGRKLPLRRDVVVISMDAQGRIAVDGGAVSWEQFNSEVVKRITESRTPIHRIALRIDRDARMDEVLRLQNLLRRIGGVALNVNYTVDLLDE